MRAYLIAGLLLLGSILPAQAQTSPQPYGNPPNQVPPVYPPFYPRYNTRDRSPLYQPGDFNNPSEQVRFQDAIEREQERLQGVYVLAAVEQNRRETPTGNPQDRLIIRGNRFFRVTNGQEQLSGTIQVTEPFGRVKQMILTHGDGPTRGTQFPALYTLELNTLRMTFEGRGNAPTYPGRMETGLGDGTVQNVWQRISQ